MTHNTTTHKAETDEVAVALAPYLADGFDHHEHEHLRPGVRVRNRGERYPEARQWGTAEVVAVLRKPGSWEQTYGRLNIEVLVCRDRADFGSALSWWADYGTFLPEGCFACGDGRLSCPDHYRPGQSDDPGLSCSALWSRNQGVSCCITSRHTVHRGSSEPDAPSWGDGECVPGTLTAGRGGR